MARGSVHSGSISCRFFVALAEPERLNLESRRLDSQIKLHRRGPAAVANAKLPHQIVGLLKRFR